MRRTSSFIMTAVLMATTIGMPVSAFAQTTTASTTLQIKLDAIAALTAQIIALQKQLHDLQVQQQHNVTDLTETFGQGTQGDQVTTLQTLLAADASLFPEGKVTGFFGPLTKRAIKRFQKKNHISQNGKVDNQTLALLNAWLKSRNSDNEHGDSMGMGTSTMNREDDHGKKDDENDSDHGRKDCSGWVPPGHMIAPGWLKHHEMPVVPTCQHLPWGTTTPPVTGTTTDTTAPVITNLVSLNVGVTGAEIQWTTNESATSKVWFGTTSPVTAGTGSMMTGAMGTNHDVVLAGLTGNTQYFYVVTSTDAAGNTATSSQSSFTTGVIADVTAPVISGIAASNLASTSATVAWTTNEAATGKVYYGTGTPLATSSALAMSTATLTTAHSFGLSGLTASTTYYYILESKDASNNAASSVQQMFTTTAL